MKCKITCNRVEFNKRLQVTYRKFRQNHIYFNFRFSSTEIKQTHFFVYLKSRKRVWWLDM